ncbi:MAG: hypothetical protein K0S07_407 [Chlamydiales bacterium]|nr:hypothetical protein [Chlamydiales bacterium]
MGAVIGNSILQETSLIYTIKDKGRLYVSSDNGKHIANFNSYNYFLTQKVAMLFGKADFYTIGNEKFVLNKNSVAKAMSGKFQAKEKAPQTDLTDILADYPIEATISLRSKLSASKQRWLDQELPKALIAGDYKGAVKLVATGADSNLKFWVGDGNRLLKSERDESRIRKSESYRATQYTPILFYAQKEMFDHVKMMKEADGDERLTGKEVVFKREFGKIKTETYKAKELDTKTEYKWKPQPAARFPAAQFPAARPARGMQEEQFPAGHRPAIDPRFSARVAPVRPVPMTLQPEVVLCTKTVTKTRQVQHYVDTFNEVQTSVNVNGDYEVGSTVEKRAFKGSYIL